MNHVKMLKEEENTHYKKENKELRKVKKKSIIEHLCKSCESFELFSYKWILSIRRSKDDMIEFGNSVIRCAR